MSLQAPREGAASPGGHVAELRLRRLRAGELVGGEADEINRHLEVCPGCRERVEVLAAEERAFQSAIPFPRFAGGVERAARVPRSRPVSRRRVFAGAGLGLVAAAAGLLLFLRAGVSPDAEQDRKNRIKGDAGGTLRLRSADGAQRTLEPGSTTRLQPGDALLLGYRASEPGHLLALSIDAAGRVTILDAAPAPAAPALRYLPESFELTGSGEERVFLLLRPEPLSAQDISAAVRSAHAAAGNLRAMSVVGPALPADVTSTTWLFEKP